MKNQCVSYESLIGSMTEMANNPAINERTRESLSNTVQYLKQNPKTAQLVKEALSNTSCTDLADIGQKIAAGYKDVASGMATGRVSGILGQTANGVDHIVSDIGSLIDRNLMGHNHPYGVGGNFEQIPPQPLSGSYGYTTPPQSGFTQTINRGINNVENGLAVIGALAVAIAGVYVAKHGRDMYRKGSEIVRGITKR